MCQSHTRTCRCADHHVVPRGSLLHRADYLHMLLDEARRLGVVLKSGCQVTHVDFSAPSVTLANGEAYNADLIVGADG